MLKRQSGKVYNADIHQLEAMMAEMNESSPSEPPSTKRSSSSSHKSKRPVSTAFPPRPSSSSSRPLSFHADSRSSSSSRLSNSTSNHSPRSEVAVHSDTTPSLGTGEWSSAHPTPSASTSRYRAEDDEDDPVTPQIGTGRSRPSSPSSTRPFPSSYPSSPASPPRLQARPPRNDRSPLDDLRFLQEALGEPDDSDNPSWSNGRATDDDQSSTHSTHSAHSRTSKHGSTRSLRLRQEIERAARSLGAKSSQDGLGISSGGSSDGGHPSSSSVSDRPASPISMRDAPFPSMALIIGPSSVPDHRYSGEETAPFPAMAGVTTAFAGEGGDDVDTRSVASAASGTSVYGPGGWSQPGSANGSASGSQIGTSGSLGHSFSARESARPRQRELKEWSQACWIWQREKNHSHGMLSKAPLIREVPAAMKRKMGKRDSSQLLSADVNFDDVKGRGGLLREMTSKATFTVGPTSSSKEGSWRKVTGVMRDDGYFRVFSEDTVILHSIHLPSILRTDVRVVDPSLFGRAHCVVIHRRQAAPPTTPGFQTKSRSTSQGSSSQGARSIDEPLYMCMPSIVAAQSWIVMAHCFARPEFYISRGGGLDVGTRSDSDLSDGEDEDGGKTVSRCRIFRSISLSINEGRGIGDPATEVPRNGTRLGHEQRRADLKRERDADTLGSASASADTFSINSTDNMSPAKPSAATRLHRGDSSRETETVGQGLDTFCEISLDGDALARSSIRKGTTSPFWNETFTFSDLPPITQPLTIKVFQMHKNSRPTLLGTTIVRVPDHPRAELIEDWWYVKPPLSDVRGKMTDTVGELNLSIRIDEEVVLPSSEYGPMLELLNDDEDAQLTSDIAHEFPTDLEEVAKVLLRVYQAESQLLPRILRLIELEVDGDVKSASILFRGNSILTKSVELYLRLVGAEYLDLSIGEPVRRLCHERVEIEIDPSRMKSGVREKDIANNVQALKEATMEVWKLIYAAREKCPNELRTIFSHIQRIVGDKYGEEHKKMRSTSVSAFIFLRFFVPAVLNPKLFALVPHPPHPKAQRTLTLVAKTLQGLANFSTFGQKEPWMFPMNSFVQENTSAFVDFIDNISTPSPGARFDWTSPSSASYLSAYRLRNSLAAPLREGVPLLPHLIDLPRDLGLLASYMARTTYERGAALAHDTASTASSRASRSTRLSEFTDRCVDVHEEAQRRGGGLVTPLNLRARGESSSSGATKLRARAATERAGWGGFMVDPPITPPRRQASVEEIHIRAAPPVAGDPAGGLEADSSGGSPPGSVASRRSHRSFTISGIPPSRTGEPLPGMSVDTVLQEPSEGESESDADVFSPTRGDFTDALLEQPAASPPMDDLPQAISDYSFPPREYAASHSPVKVLQETTIVDSSPDAALAAYTFGTATASFGTATASSAMAHQTSQSSTATSGSETYATSASSGEVMSASIVATGRRPSTAGGIMQSLMGDDAGGDAKRRGVFARMGRKNSRAGP